MKDWRERILNGMAKRACGRVPFTLKDKLDSANAGTCAWGELNARYGLGLKIDNLIGMFRNEAIEHQGCEFNAAISLQKPDEALALLERFEDQALQMKRKRGTLSR